MIIFHHNDADGRCAAAIVRRWFNAVSVPSTERNEITMIEMDYKMAPPIEMIHQNDTVVIVDFSFKNDAMKEIEDCTSNGIIWCDHHATAKSYNYEYRGKRDFSDKGLCGAELTWDFFFPREQTPYWLTLLGDYDSWRMNHKEECIQFFEGLKLYEQSPDENGVWFELFGDSNIYKEIIKKGKIAVQYRDNYCSDIISANGYETKIDNYKSYAVNMYGFGSACFGDLIDIYDVCISYINDGNKYTVSLYSSSVDVSQIAKNYGGGGHKGAAGFVCDELPFKRS